MAVKEGRAHRFVSRPGNIYGAIESCIYCGCAKHSGYYWLFPHRSTAAPPCTRLSLDGSEWARGARLFTEEDALGALAQLGNGERLAGAGSIPPASAGESANS